MGGGGAGYTGGDGNIYWDDGKVNWGELWWWMV